MFWHKKISDYFVDLSIGRVYYKELSNLLVNQARIVSERRDGTLNNEMYISYIESRLLNLNKRRFKRLGVKDGQLIRDKTIIILKNHNLVLEEEQVVALSDEEKKILADQKAQLESRLRGMR